MALIRKHRESSSEEIKYNGRKEEIIYHQRCVCVKGEGKKKFPSYRQILGMALSW